MPPSPTRLAGGSSSCSPTANIHLRLLRDAGLVRVRRDAQRRIYTLDPAGLAELDAWLARYRRFWHDRLDTLERELGGTR